MFEYIKIPIPAVKAPSPLKMSNTDKCRVCLLDGATHQIFENIESKESVYSKLLQCLKEKVEDIEGYPRKICELCNDTLNTISNFITKYQTSCKLLESSLTIKKEVCSDNEQSDIEPMKEETEIEICKYEPDSESEWLEPHNSIWSIPLTQVTKQETSLPEIKAKLKSLKEINFKKKPTRKSNHKNGKVASSILEAEFDWNGESLKSNKIKQSKEEKPKEKRDVKKLVLPKPPKVPQPPPRKLCDICGEIFKDNEKLSNHKRKIHFNERLNCPICPRTSISEVYLRKHIKRVHGENKIICDTCGNTYAHKTSLANHLKRVHLNLLKPNRKHICDKCKKGFVTAKSLIIHDRSAHTGLRPAECTECGACFFHEDYLKEHMRLHTGETPFKCPICGRGYAQRGNMRSHISHNHRLEDLSEETKKKLKPSWFKYLKKH